MANIACDLCGEEGAVLMQTDLASGETITVGQACLVTFALSSAVVFSEGAEPEEQATYADLVAGLLTNLAPSMLQLAKSAAPRPPRRKAADKAEKPAQDGLGRVTLTQGDGTGTASATSANTEP